MKIIKVAICVKLNTYAFPYYRLCLIFYNHMYNWDLIMYKLEVNEALELTLAKYGLDTANSDNG
jgi:hypothetical protein